MMMILRLRWHLLQQDTFKWLWYHDLHIPFWLLNVHMQCNAMKKISYGGQHSQFMYFSSLLLGTKTPVRMIFHLRRIDTKICTSSTQMIWSSLIEPKITLLPRFVFSLRNLCFYIILSYISTIFFMYTLLVRILLRY